MRWFVYACEYASIVSMLRRYGGCWGGGVRGQQRNRAAAQKLSILVCWAGTRSRSDEEGCIIADRKHTLDGLIDPRMAKPPQIDPAGTQYSYAIATTVSPAYLHSSSTTVPRWTICARQHAHRQLPAIR
jgi:hypothetical protein